MRAITRQYRIYKDRFLLSLAISLLTHAVVFLCYILLPQSEKEISLQPISLGVLQNKLPKEFQRDSMQSDNQERAKQPLQESPTQAQSKPSTSSHSIKQSPAMQNPNMNIKIRSQAPTIQTESDHNSSPPQLDIDLQSLSLPQGKFNPLAIPEPSLTQSIKDKENNAKLETLPPRVLEELERLYGNNIHKMSKEQKDYLAESYFINYGVFQQTADRMGYPKLAAYLKQQGEGVIEFTLYPDGHVEDIKILVSTKYEVLDDSMRQVIELSAKNLKRPPVPISIRIGGKYSIHE